MDSRRRPALIVLLCLSLLSSACLARRRLITRNGKTTPQRLLTASAQQLEDLIARQYQAIQNFSATVDMTPALGSAEKSRITEYKDVRAYILFRRPEDIRLIGLYPVVRNKAFDMVSNGTSFRLYIPAKNRFITGSNEITSVSKNKLENLRPQHFVDALLVRPRQPGDRPLLLNLTDESEAVYILGFVRQSPEGQLRISRSVWFDRTSLSLVRQLVFDAEGNILSDDRYSNWQVYDGVPFPKHVEINRPQDEYGVVLTVVKMDINKGVTEDKFVLEQPEGSQLQRLGEKPQSPKESPRPPEKKRKRDL